MVYIEIFCFFSFVSSLLGALGSTSAGASASVSAGSHPKATMMPAGLPRRPARRPRPWRPRERRQCALVRVGEARWRPLGRGTESRTECHRGKWQRSRRRQSRRGIAGNAPAGGGERKSLSWRLLGSFLATSWLDLGPSWLHLWALGWSWEAIFALPSSTSLQKSRFRVEGVHQRGCRNAHPPHENAIFATK